MVQKPAIAVKAPAVRVSAARDMLAFTEVFEPGLQARVVARIPREAMEAMEASARTSWLDLELDHFLVDGICEELGPERAIRCWRDSMKHMIDKPLLQSFVSGMIRLFGRDPARVVALIPKGWPLVFRDCGTLTVLSSGDREAILAFSDLPPVFRRYPNYFHSFHGICAGVLLVATPRGRVDYVVAKDHASATARFVWE
jgi:hypothetical protein